MLNLSIFFFEYHIGGECECVCVCVLDRGGVL